MNSKHCLRTHEIKINFPTYVGTPKRWEIYV